MANASETYQGTLPRSGGLSKERVRRRGARGAAVLVAAFAAIEPLRHAAGQFFGSLDGIAAIVAG